MARRIPLLNLALSFLLMPVLANAVGFGDTPDAVEAELGPPNGKRSTAGGEIWVYSGDITIEFEQGQLVRAKGLVMEDGAVQERQAIVRESAPLPAEEVAPEPEIIPEAAPEPEPMPEPVVSEEEQLVEALPDIEDARALAQQLEEELSSDFEDIPQGSSVLATVLDWTIPIFLTFIFLVIAFKWVGAEAMKGALLVIAIVDRLVVVGIQAVFQSVLEFPTTFHADTLVSVFVMLALITKLTHAKQLPTAIKVVIASKVAGWIAFWLLAMFVLGSLG